MNAIQRNANTTEKKYLYEDAFNPRVDTKVFYKFYISLSFSKFFSSFVGLWQVNRPWVHLFQLKKAENVRSFDPPQLKILNRN